MKNKGILPPEFVDPFCSSATSLATFVPPARARILITTPHAIYHSVRKAVLYLYFLFFDFPCAHRMETDIRRQ
jgi:hypothetical protein